MVAIVVEECPWIFNIHSPSYVLRHDWVKNGKAHSISGNYRKYIRIDPERRRAYRETENQPNRMILLYAALLLLAVSLPAVVLTHRRRRG
jgi:hypothetical protein